MAQSTGYSGTPLPRKLGFKPGMLVLVVDAPDHYAELLAGAKDVTFYHGPELPAQKLDAVHIFLHDPKGIAECVSTALACLKPGGRVWLSWAKKASPLHAGILEDALRDAVLPLGWVDVKVCAVDADWSGLMFLKRKDKSA